MGKSSVDILAASPVPANGDTETDCETHTRVRRITNGWVKSTTKWEKGAVEMSEEYSPTKPSESSSSSRNMGRSSLREAMDEVKR